MKHQIYFRKQAIRFCRYCRARYAAFVSMHQVVNIGHLATYIADRQLRKSAVSLALVLPLLGNMAMAQNDDTSEVHLLPTLDITAPADSILGSPDAVAIISKSQLQGLAVSTVAELLEQLPGVDLRTRGGGDVQGDITMRGGTFDQMIILLNGVNLSDAQTGHNNLDIPIDLSMVDRVEIIPASALLHYGLSSFCGAINIVVGQKDYDLAKLQFSSGSFGQVHLSGSVTKTVGRWSLSAAASYNHSNGYMKNTDYSHGSMYLQAYRKDDVGSWLIQLGAQMKDFGSQAFYSIKYPDQYEETRTMTASASRQRKWHNWQLEYTLYTRLHKDRFELFRESMVEAPSWYGGHNYHLSTNAGLRLRAARDWKLGTTSFGTELRDESIISTVLGDSLSNPRPIYWESGDLYYTLGKSRLTTNIFANHSIRLGKTRLSAGVLGSHNTLMGTSYGYSLSADYPINEYWKANVSISRSFRLPTYTELYYHSASQIGNINLKSEVSHSAEINIRYHKNHFFGAATLYGRHGNNIIDWVRKPEESVWHSINHTSIDAVGTDIQLGYSSHKFLRQISLNYSYCTIDQQADDYISNYVLDYLKHKIGLDIVVSPIRNLRIKVLANYRYRIGGYTNLAGDIISYSPVFLLNAGAEYDIWKCTLFLDGYNLLDKEYCDYGGIPQAGVSVLGGVKMRL